MWIIYILLFIFSFWSRYFVFSFLSFCLILIHVLVLKGMNDIFCDFVVPNQAVW